MLYYWVGGQSQCENRDLYRRDALFTQTEGKFRAT